MQYGDSLKGVLLRKINRAERDLVQLKLDYCRFVFGLTHRTCVEKDGRFYQVTTVDVDTMERDEQGEYSPPAVSGLPVDDKGRVTDRTPVELGRDWALSERSRALSQ